mmetsp:Transcript_9545/g.23026  ORF Transcript_9545/g.23026 Transcript_9545/m.23026 type:complete len:684 (-) Transcript_9545:43-2094(-)
MTNEADKRGSGPERASGSPCRTQHTGSISRQRHGLHKHTHAHIHTTRLDINHKSSSGKRPTCEDTPCNKFVEAKRSPEIHRVPEVIAPPSHSAPPSAWQSRAVPHADEIGALAWVRVARVGDSAGRAVEAEDGDRVGVLVGDEQPLARLVKLEVARRLAARVEDAGEREQAGRRRVLVDAVDGDRVVAAVGRDDKVARRVDRHAAARVEFARVRLGQRRDALRERERGGGAREHRLLVGGRRALLVGDGRAHRDVGGEGGVEFEDGDLGGELVDDVRHVERRVELHIARAEAAPAPLDLDAARDLAAWGERPARLVKVELADDIHAEVGHVRDAARRGVEHDGMGVRVALPLGLRLVVVARVVDVLVAARLHRLAQLRVVRREHAPNGAVGLELERVDRRVPVVDEQHAAALGVNGEVARRGAAGADARAVLVERARRPLHLERDDLAFFLDRLGTSVDDRQARVAPRERRVVHDLLADEREERERAVRDVQAVRAHCTRRFGAARAVREVAEVGVARDEDDGAVLVRRRRVRARVELELGERRLGALDVHGKRLVRRRPGRAVGLQRQVREGRVRERERNLRVRAAAHGEVGLGRRGWEDRGAVLARRPRARALAVAVVLEVLHGGHLAPRDERGEVALLLVHEDPAHPIRVHGRAEQDGRVHAVEVQDRVAGRHCFVTPGS